MDALHGRQLNVWRKSFTATTQECCEQYWTSYGSNTLRSSGSTATYDLSWKLSELDEPDMRNTARELISNLLRWTPSHGRAKVWRPARTYTQQLCTDTGCSPEDPLEAMDDREGWPERVRDISVRNAMDVFNDERAVCFM